ncbi:MAG: hypothetical protein ACRCX2_06250 [Paraclostridium sp.]
MKDKLKEFVENEKIEIPHSFELKFEETLDRLPDKKVHKINKYKAVASIGLTIFVASGVAMAMSDGIYKYIPTEGVIMDSEKSIYIMEEPLVVTDSSGEEITFDMSIHEEMNRAIINIGGKHEEINPVKTTLKIGGKEYKSWEQYTHEYNNTWGMVDVFKHISKYNVDEEIVYTMYLDEEDTIEFKTKLKEANGVSTYSDIGIASEYNNIPINAVIDEKEEYVTASFMSELIEKGISVTTGIDGIDGVFSGIYLEDISENRVYGMREVSGGSMKPNQVKFDTRKITKPYKVVVPQIRMDLNYNDEAIATSEEVKLTIPKDGESIEFDKDIKFNLDDKIIKTENDKVKIVKGTRIKNKYIVEIEYPNNERGRDELISVIGVKESIFGKEKRAWSQVDTDEDINFINILEFEVNSFDKELEFKLAPTAYELKGSWEFNIK